MVSDEIVDAYCKAWGESFSQANSFDVLAPLSDDLKKHIRVGLEAAFAATGKQSLQVATPPANARLIAAAPDLLVALKAAVARQSYVPCKGPDWWEQGRKAIASATGQDATSSATSQTDV
jgi:hypothetical protein